MATEAEMALALHNQLLNDPKTRKSYLKQIKEKFPGAPIPEIDAAAPVESDMLELRKELQSLRKELKEEKQDNKILSTFSSLKGARGYTDEGLEGIKKLMVEKSIADPEAAADHFDRLNHKPAPVEPSAFMGSRAFNQNPEQDALKDWLENPDSMVDRIIGEVMTEKAQGRL
jgi:molecular chaperone GrpE (heat shock protein)